MANNKIKGLVVEIGGDTTKLGKALDSVDRQSRGLSSELADVNKLLKLDPKNTELLGQKQQILADLVGQTSKRLDALRAANDKAAKSAENYDKWLKKYEPLQQESETLKEQLKQLQKQQRAVADENGPESKEYQDLQTEAARVRDALKQVQQQQREVTKEFGDPAAPDQLRSLQREIAKTEQQLKTYAAEQEKAADGSTELKRETEKAEKAVKEEGQAAKTSAEENKTLKAAGKTAAEGLEKLAIAAGTALTSIIALGETTRDYRREMGKLDTAFETAGHTQESARETYKSLQSVLGDTDQAVEAANHLAKLTDNAEELNKWTDTLTGVYATFGASLPIEGLTEAANETAKTGQITGNLADALNWAAQEGETFGVKLKENIEFTELTADEVGRLTDAELEEYEAKKAQYEAVEAYNQSVRDAASAEDFFNIALSECSTEQERQTKITETLNSMYGDAAEAYRRTNDEVIHANKVQEHLNEALAECGSAVEPIVTDVKELGIALLEELEDPLKKVANFIRQKFIPQLKKFADWVKKNLPVIIGLIGGATAGLGAYKIATLGAKVATEGLTIATWLQVAAQKALNAVMKLNPLGLAIGAALTLTGVIVGLVESSKDTETAFDRLSESEQKLSTEAREAAESFRDQQQATQDAIAQTQAEMGHVESLADELFTLADANGRVSELNKGRADFILGQLNDALGTEYKMNGNLIAQYDELTGSIEQAIEKKKASLLLEAYEEDYVAALKNKSAAFQEMTAWQKQYAEESKPIIDQQEYLMDLERRIGDLRGADNELLKANLEAEANSIRNNIAALEEKRAATKEQLDIAAANYGGYLETIDRYEDAAAAAAEGRTADVEALLDRRTGAIQDYGDNVDAETARVLDAMREDAVEAGRIADAARKRYEKDQSLANKGALQKAEENYAKLTKVYADAKQDATGAATEWGKGYIIGVDGTKYPILDEVHDVVTAIGDTSAESAYVAGLRAGEYYGDGLSSGVQSKINQAINAGYKLGGALDDAARGALEINSPSRKAIEIGQYYGEGLEIGLKRSAADVAAAAKDQANKLLDAQKALQSKALSPRSGAAKTTPGRVDSSRTDASRSIEFGNINITVSGSDNPRALAQQLSIELERQVRRRLAIEGT